jgi:hypothetical protein
MLDSGEGEESRLDAYAIYPPKYQTDLSLSCQLVSAASCWGDEQRLSGETKKKSDSDYLYCKVLISSWQQKFPSNRFLYKIE